MSDPESSTLFLCWSGRRSKQVAESFKQYFESLFKAAKWHTEPKPSVEMSETLIEKGAPWSDPLLEKLGNAQAGIVCLTPENRGSAWLHFEGGAIATHRLKHQDGAAKSATSANTLFSFLFTMDNTHIESPLSLFQATIYRRDYDRDRAEIKRLTRAVLKCFKGCEDAAQDGEPLSVLLGRLLSELLGRLRELQFLAFRDLVPGLEGHARQVIQATKEVRSLPGRVRALSAILSLQQLLEDCEREMEIICAPSQHMFFERLVEVLSASSRGLERAIAKGSKKIPKSLAEILETLRRILEVAVEPLVPVLDDAWRYAFYALHERQDRQEAYRKQKLLLVHPLESTLQRAELEASSPSTDSKVSDAIVPPGQQRAELEASSPSTDSKVLNAIVPSGQLLSHNEKLRALRSFWAYDRVAAYIHYCEDISRPTIHELERTLEELTWAVLKEISLIEVSPGNAGQQALDDLPLRFAVRALILKIKIGIGHGSYGSGDQTPVLEKPRVRAVIESRIKGETGLSFEQQFPEVDKSQ
jgi:hypothetical protein